MGGRAGGTIAEYEYTHASRLRGKTCCASLGNGSVSVMGMLRRESTGMVKATASVRQGQGASEYGGVGRFDTLGNHIADGQRQIFRLPQMAIP